MTDRSPPSFRPHLTLRLHLPSFTHTSVEELRELMAGQTGFADDGWLEVACPGWQLDEGTTMEIQKATQL